MSATRAVAIVTALGTAAALVLLPGPITASAAPERASAVKVTPLQSPTNLLPRPDRTEALTSARLAAWQCPTKKQSAKPPKLSRALKTAAKVAAGRVGAKGMKVFRKSAQYDSVKSLLKLEAAAGADDRRLPALLAIQLRLHQLSPRDPGPLVDAAGILANLNKPREALALLNAADKTHRSMAAPLGMNGTAIALNNRGYALLRLGQYAQARRVLTQAIKKEPLLSEARTNRSAANLCQYPKQLWLNAGITRSPAGPAKKPPVDVNVTVAPPSPGLKPIELPEARSWDQVGSNGDAMDRWLDRLAAEKRTGVPKLTDPLLIASGESTRAVYDAFVHTIDEASQDPRLSGDAAEALEKAMEYRFHEMQYGDGSAWKCAWQIGWYYNDFRPAYNAHRRNLLSWSLDYQRLTSEFANSLANDDARALLMWRTRASLLQLQSTMVTTLREASSHWAPPDPEGGSPGCTLGNQAPNPDDAEPVSSVPDNGCMFQTPVVDTGYVEFHQNCEERYVELHLPGALSPFLRVSQHVPTGNVTFMSGGKASVSLLKGGKIVKAGVSTKLGVYATFTSANPLHPSNRMVGAGWVKPAVTGSVRVAAVKISKPINSVVSSFNWPGGRF